MPEENAPVTIHADTFRITVGNLGVYVGAFEITPQTAMLLDGAADGEFLTELKAVVRMGPMQAKMLAILLKQALQDYEQQNGEIALPAEMTESPGVEW